MRSLEDLLPLFTVPVATFVSMAVVIHLGRPDLMVLPLTAGMLMSIGQMALFVGGEVVEGDRTQARFEPFVGAPMPYSLQIFCRVLALTGAGLLGAVETWIVARFGFGATLVVVHPVLLAVALGVTCVAAAGTAVLLSALFAMGRTARTYQNAISGPLYLMGGVLVPASLLPAEIQPLCKMVFLYWSAELVRASFGFGNAAVWPTAISMIAALGTSAALLGHWATKRMTHNLAVSGEANLT